MTSEELHTHSPDSGTIQIRKAVVVIVILELKNGLGFGKLVHSVAPTVGRRKLAQVVKTQIGSEAEEFVAARKRAQRELNKINKTINNLLDNLTSTNREFVDQRLTELKQQKHQFEIRLDELDRLGVSQAEIKSIVADAMQFVSSLEFTLCEGLAQEKLVALRRCIEKISINKPDGTVKLTLRSVPVGNLESTKEYQVSL